MADEEQPSFDRCSVWGNTALKRSGYDISLSVLFPLDIVCGYSRGNRKQPHRLGVNNHTGGLLFCALVSERLPPTILIVVAHIHPDSI